MARKDVQKRILKAILSNGGSANTTEISNLTGFNIWDVNRGTFHLVNRSLIKKRRPEKTYPRKPNTYILNEKRLSKIKRLISEIGR